MIRKIWPATASILISVVAAGFVSAASAAGWSELPGTRLKDVCPENNFGDYGYDFSNHCGSILGAWSGGTLDADNQIMYIWGGGHNDYYGNEIYALDATTGKLKRLTDPAPPSNKDISPPQSELAPFDGTQPNGRHTYDGLAYMGHVDKLWAFTGSLSSGSGGADRLTWIFDPQSRQWHKDESKGDIPRATFGLVSAYDPVTDKVFLHDRYNLYSYEYHADGGVYKKLSAGNVGLDVNGALDPQRRRLLIIGKGKQIVYDLRDGSLYQGDAVPLTGDADFIRKHKAPGLAYNSKDGKFYAWVGDGKLYFQDPDTLAWDSIAFDGGPSKQVFHGTFGRFDYLPDMDKFLLVNGSEDNAYLFELPTAADSESPCQPTKVQASFPHPGALSVTWQPSEDNFGIAGYKVFVNGELHSTLNQIRFKSMEFEQGQQLNIQIQAFDSAGNHSEMSAPYPLQMPVMQARYRMGDCDEESQLAGRDDIVFCESWDQDDWWDKGDYLSEPVVNEPRLITQKPQNTEIVEEGCVQGKCLKVNMKEGATKALSAYWPLKNANMAPQNLYMRYYLKMDKDWDANMCNAKGNIVGSGGKFPGLADTRTWKDPVGQCGNGGNAGDGENCWSMRMVFRGCESGSGEACETKPAAATRLGSYLYHALQGSGTGHIGTWDGYFGQIPSYRGTCAEDPKSLYCGMGDGGVLEREQWNRIEMQVTMNTPGQEDGVIRGWVNGQLSYEKTNMVFRNEGHDFLHNRLAWLNIYKGGVDGNCQDSAVYLDQMVLATEQPVGGIDSPTTMPPSLQIELSNNDISSEEAVTVSWQADNAQSCEASGLWEGNKGTSGEEIIGPFSQPGVVRLDCRGAGGTAARQQVLTIDGQNPGQANGEIDLSLVPTPEGLALELLSDNYLTLRWEEADAQDKVTAYRIYQGDLMLDQVSDNSYSHPNIVPGAKLEYRIQAVDEKGNMSSLSDPLQVEVPGSLSDLSSLTLYPDMDTFYAESTVKVAGQSKRFHVATSRNALLRFPLEMLDYQRVTATLKLYTDEEYGDMRIDVYAVAQPWHEDFSNREYADTTTKRAWQHNLGDWLDKNGVEQGTAPIASVEAGDDNRPSEISIDITRQVRKWLAGEPNHGLMLIAHNDGKWVARYIHSKEAEDPSVWPRLELAF